MLLINGDGGTRPGTSLSKYIIPYVKAVTSRPQSKGHHKSQEFAVNHTKAKRNDVITLTTPSPSSIVNVFPAVRYIQSEYH